MTIDLYPPGASGDMYQQNASGLLVPVDGTPATGNVPTRQSDGTVAWAAVPGGGVSSYAYWMVLVLKIQTAGGNARIGELALRTASGGSNVATGGTPIYTDQAASSGDNSAAAAFDANTATGWASGATTLPAGVGYQLASAQAIVEIVITARNDAFGPPGSPTVLTVIAGTDGVNWFPQWQVTSPATWTAGLARTFTRPT